MLHMYKSSNKFESFESILGMQWTVPLLSKPFINAYFVKYTHARHTCYSLA